MAEEKRYYWLKLHDDFFDTLKIKKLRKMAGGDTYTIIYLEMQLLAIKSEGLLMWTGLEDNIAAELALLLDESVENVKVTLSYLISCGLVETSDNINFFLPSVISNTGSETAVAQRVRAFREKQSALQCNNRVTHMKQTCYAEKEIEKEKDIEIEKEKVNEKEKPSFSSQKFVSSHSNVRNFDAIKHTFEYLNSHRELSTLISEWLIYKDEKKPKSSNHYDSERGLRTLIDKFIASDKEYGTKEVARVVRDTMSSNYMGIVWDKLKGNKNNGNGHTGSAAERYSKQANEIYGLGTENEYVDDGNTTPFGDMS